MEKKFIGMNKNVVLGLGWLLFPFSIVALAVDHDKMDKEDKLDFVQSLVFNAVTIIITTILEIVLGIVTAVSTTGVGDLIATILTLVVSILLLVFFIIGMVKAFKGVHYEMPLCYAISKAFVKDNPQPEQKEEQKAE